MFSIYCVTASLPCLAALCACGAPKTQPIISCLYIGFGCSFFVKAAIFLWGVYLRFRSAGRVAAGKMVTDCIANQEPVDVSSNSVVYIT